MTSTIKPLTLTQLNNRSKIVNEDGTPLPSFTQTINNAFSNIIVSFNALATQGADTAALVASIVALNNLVTSATAASALVNSYTNPTSVLSYTIAGTTATITIADHTRQYSNGASVAVTGGSIISTDLGLPVYVFYSDPNRSGGIVTYQQSTLASDAAQVGSVHCVGVVTLGTTDTSAPIVGVGSQPPGVPRFISPDVREP